MILAIAIAGVIGWSSNYQPVDTAGGGTWVDPTHARNLGDFTPPGAADFTQFDISFEDGASFGFAFTLTNDGSLPVTIRSIGDVGSGCCVMLEYVRTLVAPADGPHMFDQKAARPFTPFTLAPDVGRMVVIETRFANCSSWERSVPGSRTGAVYSEVPIEISVLGVPHSDRVRLPFTLDIARHSPCRDDA